MIALSIPTEPFPVVRDDSPRVAQFNGAVAAIGNFDGVHRGHRAVIDAAVARAAAFGSPAIAVTFEPFFTTKDVGKGTGLGLSMVYGFVKQSGGHARIVSEVGKGTVVRLYLPGSDIAATTATLAPVANAELPTGKETILFVEDDPMVRQHTGRQIVSLGYNVVEAENGADAIARVASGFIPDLLLDRKSVV